MLADIVYAVRRCCFFKPVTEPLRSKRASPARIVERKEYVFCIISQEAWPKVLGGRLLCIASAAGASKPCELHGMFQTLRQVEGVHARQRSIKRGIVFPTHFPAAIQACQLVRRMETIGILAAKRSRSNSSTRCQVGGPFATCRGRF